MLNGQLTPWLEGEELQLPVHVLWCRHANFVPDFVEVLLNEATPTDFLFRRNGAITLPLGRTFLPSQSGLPILAPEIVLLYKARAAAEPNNSADFHLLRRFLDPSQRDWLKAAITKLHPYHDWLRDL